MNGEHQYSSFFPIFALYISAESPRVGKDMCIIYGEDVYKRLAFGFQNFAPFDLSKEQMATGNVLVVCIFTYCPSLFGKGHAVYISAWAFCVVRSWWYGIVKALKHGTDEGEIPTPLLYILAGITIIRSSNGNPGDAHLQNDMIHAGQLIERTLHEQGRTVTWFASQLCCTRPNVYKIFRKENIDIHLLWRISCILNHDFFHDLSDSISTGSSSGVSK